MSMIEVLLLPTTSWLSLSLLSNSDSLLGNLLWVVEKKKLYSLGSSNVSTAQNRKHEFNRSWTKSRFMVIPYITQMPCYIKTL